MRHSNWQNQLLAERARTGERLEKAAAQARAAELALSKCLHPEAHHTELRCKQLQGDPQLMAAREAFRREHRRHVALMDEWAGFDEDLRMSACANH